MNINKENDLSKLSLVEKLREIAVENCLQMPTVERCWPKWKKVIKKKLGKKLKDLNGKKIFDLGDDLREIFSSTSTKNKSKKRSQGSLSSGGKAWECLLVWYINLCLINTRAVVFKYSKKIIPQSISDALALDIRGNSFFSETDLLGITLPNNEAIISKKLSDDKEAIHLLNKLSNEEFSKFEVTVIQCKTNWNDSSQIPFLYDFVYNLTDNNSTDLKIGINDRNVRQFKKFAYCFATVPTQKDLDQYKQGKVSVERVRHLSGGNYWGSKSKNGVISSIKEITNKNFLSAFNTNNNVTENINNNLNKLMTDYKYFRLNY